jgi:hypothetical protein
MNRKSSLSNYLVISVVSLVLGFSGILQAQTDYDTVQIDREIAVMKSIIETSLNLARKSVQAEGSRSSGFDSRFQYWEQFSGGGGVNGYYLYGQGAVFTIPYPCLSGKSPREWDEVVARIEELKAQESPNVGYLLSEMAFLESQIQMEQRELDMMRSSGESLFETVPFEEPESPETVEPRAPRGRDTEARKEALEKRIKRLQERLEKGRERSEDQRAKAEKERELIREELFRVIATHGDSLTEVKDDEYINLILNDSCEPFRWNRNREGRSQSVLSVRKSDLGLYRSGQLTLDQLKQKFIEY